MMTTSDSEEKNFLGVAVAAIPRVTEIIAAYPAEYRSGALETAERCYMEAAREFGCTEVAALNSGLRSHAQLANTGGCRRRLAGGQRPTCLHAPKSALRACARKYKLIFPVICGPLRIFLQVTWCRLWHRRNPLLRTWRADRNRRA